MGGVSSLPEVVLDCSIAAPSGKPAQVSPPRAAVHLDATCEALVHRPEDIVAVQVGADREDKRAICDDLGVNLTYHPDGRVHVGAGARVLGFRVGGGGLEPLVRATPGPRGSHLQLERAVRFPSSLSNLNTRLHEILHTAAGVCAKRLAA